MANVFALEMKLEFLWTAMTSSLWIDWQTWTIYSKSIGNQECGTWKC